MLEHQLYLLLQLGHLLALGSQDGVLLLQAGGADVAAAVGTDRYALLHALRIFFIILSVGRRYILPAATLPHISAEHFHPVPPTGTIPRMLTSTTFRLPHQHFQANIFSDQPY